MLTFSHGLGGATLQLSSPAKTTPLLTLPSLTIGSSKSKKTPHTGVYKIEYGVQKISSSHTEIGF